MLANHIKTFVDAHKNDNIKIITDEACFFNTKGSGNVVVFDYTNELVHVFRTNLDVYTQSTGQPYEVTIFEFDRIVSLAVTLDYTKMSAILETLKDEVTEDEYAAFVEIMSNTSYAAGSNFNPSTGGKMKEVIPVIKDANNPE